MKSATSHRERSALAVGLAVRVRYIRRVGLILRDCECMRQASRTAPVVASFSGCLPFRRFLAVISAH